MEIKCNAFESHTLIRHSEVHRSHIDYFAQAPLPTARPAQSARFESCWKVIELAQESGS